MSACHVKAGGALAARSAAGSEASLLDHRGDTIRRIASRVTDLVHDSSARGVEVKRLTAGLFIYAGNLDRAHDLLLAADEARQLAMALVARGVYAALPLVGEVRSESLALARATSRGERSFARALAILRNAV